MAKQISIEWFWDKFVNEPIKMSDLIKILEQAKQMHKEEIQEAFNKGYDLRDEYDEFGWGRQHEGADERYYQETYGGNK